MSDDTTRIKMREWLPDSEQLLDGPPDLAAHVYYEALQEATALIHESVCNWTGILKLAPIPDLDSGIAPWVEILRAHRIETYESCQGGARDDGSEHAYAEPTIAFNGGPEAGFRSYSVAVTHALPVQCIRRVWKHQDNEPTGPVWEMVFRRQATPQEAEDIMHTLAFERGEA